MAKVQVLDFYAEWCGPCRAMSPSIKSLTEEYQGSEVEIKKVNVDTEPELTQKYDIKSIPTLVFLKESEEVDRTSGAIPKEKIKEKIEKILVD